MENGEVLISGYRIPYSYVVITGARKNMVIIDIRGDGIWDELRAADRINEWNINVYIPRFPAAGRNADDVKYSGGIDSASEFYYDFVQAMRLKNVMLMGEGINADVALKCSMNHPEKYSNIIAIDATGYEGYAEELYRVQKPVLLIWGGARGYRETMIGQSYHDLIAGSVFKVFDNSKRPLEDSTDRFFSMLKNYIAVD
ncbi:alpha/beta hydrolase [Thermoplasma sp.]|uniref:alpha/beta hydrolase n=1 Tax=Thermoplasma sp. TaxID=1973142 RepID=UPI00126DB377|nr:alpha/beta hydrolase [Thermoplasma sp.]KAA8922077.1 MAG: alpha/beta hydrolase [Thermoplasma sp.]